MARPVQKFKITHGHLPILTIVIPVTNYMLMDVYGKTQCFKAPALYVFFLFFLWAGGIMPSALKPFEAYCAKPRFEFPRSSPEAFHVRRRERPLLAKGGIMGEKWPVKFGLTMRLLPNCWVLLHAAKL
jgi:hypothetical protein